MVRRPRHNGGQWDVAWVARTGGVGQGLVAIWQEGKRCHIGKHLCAVDKKNSFRVGECWGYARCTRGRPAPRCA